MVIPFNFQTGNQTTPPVNNNSSIPVPVTSSSSAPNANGTPAETAPPETAQPTRSGQMKSIREDTLEYWYGGNTSDFDVVGKYRWTLSEGRSRDDIPHAHLSEYNANETMIQKQLNYYTQLVPDKAFAAAGVAGLANSLDVYKEIFPHTDRDNCCTYRVPYFNKTNMELTTQAWQEITPAGEALAAEASKLGKFAEGVAAGLNILNKMANIATAAQYPVVGVLDRPKIFAAHSERTITISFPLFNTVNTQDWKANQRLITKLMSQNMLYKTSYVTGVPPVFYEVLIPGQYYCWASCVTNINIENLGNKRVIDSSIVPDAYQVTITLTEMVMPSKNQFDARYNGTGKVNVSLQGAVNNLVQ